MPITIPDKCLRSDARGCIPLAQIESDCGDSFVCSGHIDEVARTIPQDEFRLCWVSKTVDEMGDYDQQDIIDTVSVLSQALSVKGHMDGYDKAARGATSTEEIGRLREEVARLKEHRKSAMLLKAISKHNTIDAEEVADLIGLEIDIDCAGRLCTREGRFFLDSALLIGTYVARWLEERPHHLRPSTRVLVGGLTFTGIDTDRIVEDILESLATDKRFQMKIE